MNTEEIINDILINQKHLVSNYSTYLCETSTNALYKNILSFMEETASSKNNIFKIMIDNNWYMLENVDESKIKQKYNEYAKKELD